MDSHNVYYPCICIEREREWKRDREHTELPAKLLDYFLRGNKSNINQIYLYILMKRGLPSKAKWASVTRRSSDWLLLSRPHGLLKEGFFGFLLSFPNLGGRYCPSTKLRRKHLKRGTMISMSQETDGTNFLVSRKAGAWSNWSSCHSFTRKLQGGWENKRTIGRPKLN